MTSGCCGPDFDAAFDRRAARRELAAYQRAGATGTARRLVEAIRSAGVQGATILDIGGGIGTVGFELLAAGASRLTEVDAARAYIDAARGEAARRGLADRASFMHGDFVALADAVTTADVVTLDRVICCYGNWRSLVERSTARARRLYGIAYPVERPWMRVLVGLGNLASRLAGRRFRFYVHPERAVDAAIRGRGFRTLVRERGLAWQTVVYERIR
jgi:hypothetical protein